MHSPFSFNITRFNARTSLLLSGMFALGLAGCGASAEPLGESEQPITAGDPDDTDAEQPGNGSSDACALGTPAEGPFGQDCQVIARGLCFSTAEDACACGGCGLAACAIAESFPARAFCQNDDGDGSDPNTPVSDDGSTSSGGGVSGSPGSSGGVSGSPGQTDPAPPSLPENCDFVVGGVCFSDGASACAAAGCADGECLVLESYPAQITCGS